MVADFASSAMVAILCEGMRRQGLEPPSVGRVVDARVSLELKRAVVSSCLRQGGWRSLARLGSGIQAIRGLPLHRALTASVTPGDFLARWSRMERYVHSRHRIIVAADGTRYQAEHVARDGGAPPLPEESVVVMGVLAAAIAECGFAPVSVMIERQPVYPDGDEATLRRLVERVGVARWTIECAVATDLPLPAGDEASAVTAADPVRFAQRLREHLLDDLIAPPSVSEAARLLGTSSRSLQRRLAVQGLSYSDLVARIRCEVAGWQLIHTDASVAEIGFLCGFSDQAHFSRTFRRRCAVPPARFRAQFGRRSPGDGRR